MPASRFVRRATAAPSLALLALAPAAQAVLIDDFSAGTNAVLNAADGSVSDRQGPLAGVVDSGWRAVVSRNFSPDQGTGNSIAVTGGALVAVRGPGPGSADFQLQYTGEEFPGNGSWDYTGLAGEDTLFVDFLSNTTSALKVSVQAIRYDAGFANFTQSVTSSAFATTTGGPSSVAVDLTPLNLAAFGPIDALDVTFSFDPQPYDFNQTVNQAFTVTRIDTVIPEPASLAMLGLSGLLLTRRSRRG
ncbi:PEP-CTERM sorting domain-containing protein [Phycisphaera mikurensis]|uniref:PEP-CTERM protein-sorting domain-containing protein n=1 Tax=Phycisphaera mikurensis (strain NBRC 102666 / KCTC 22515 / FYK2301M01) TaxID=1142394 RepID=I0ICW3_PHYMF|nr:PEP-CTERM sorting domain-containing protein [Phycisphaera mikurensis]MBB6442231.1 hypothetical protein [Phycisphaera mikurensis]BAM03101.1 hypothetical protein PSMK_09420 [Phycisphaera mikurensis NBRC 102666]